MIKTIKLEKDFVLDGYNWKLIIGVSSHVMSQIEDAQEPILQGFIDFLESDKKIFVVNSDLIDIQQIKLIKIEREK